VPVRGKDLRDLGHPGGKHDEVGLDEDAVRVAACLDDDVTGPERLHLPGELAQGLHVGDRHPGAPCVEDPGGGDAAPRHAYHRRPFAGKIRMHRTSKKSNSTTEAQRHRELHD
jgi:hypothetical protein